MGIVINGLSKKIALLRAALEASTSDWVVVSYKCKGLCNKKRCWCFKEQRSALFTATVVIRITIVGF